MITNAFAYTVSYAILIMLVIKRIENRNMMPHPASERCAVGCSKSFYRGNGKTLPTRTREDARTYQIGRNW